MSDTTISTPEPSSSGEGVNVASDDAGVQVDRERDRYYRIFEGAGVAIWELDYAPVVKLIRRLRRIGVSDLRSCLRQRPKLIERVFRAIRIGDVNEEALRLTGAPDKETVRGMREFFVSLQDGFVEAIGAVAEGRREFRTNDILRTYRGDERKVAITLRIPSDMADGDRALFCAHDITELDSERRRYELATAAGGVAVFEYHIRTNEVVLDATLQREIGFADGPILGEDMVARIHPADLASVMTRFEEVLRDDAPVDHEGNTPVPEYEVRLIGSDGKEWWFLKRGTVIRHPDGRPDRMIGTMTDITDRKLMEEAVRVSQDRLRDLAGRLIAAQEQERLRIARDLDDDLDLRLGRIADTLRLMRVETANQAAPIRLEIRRLELEIEQLRKAIGGLSDAMYPAFPEAAGFVAAFESLCSDFGRIEGINVRLMIGSGFASLPRSIGACLYRVAQEALRNTARHSGSHAANVSLEMENGSVVMRIRDFGCGFDQPVEGGQPGLGLISMRERVRLAGGELSITSRRDTGTDIHVAIPLSRY